MTVNVFRDIPIRKRSKNATADTWIESGIYEVKRDLENGRYLIIVQDQSRLTGRILTCIRYEECFVVGGHGDL